MRLLSTILALSVIAFCLMGPGREGIAAGWRGCPERGSCVTGMQWLAGRSQQAAGSRQAMPGEVLPASAEILPVPRQFAEGYAIYDRYGYATIGNQHVIVDSKDRRILLTLQ